MLRGEGACPASFAAFPLWRRVGSELRAVQRLDAAEHYRLRVAASNRREHGLDNSP